MITSLWSVPPPRPSAAKRVLLILAAGMALFTAYAVPGLYGAVQHSRQNRTMALLRSVAEQIERGMPVTSAADAWGNPMYIRIAGPGDYTIRSAGSDGIFESGPPRGSIHHHSEDLVFDGGALVQWLEGI
ncbi:MAG TPA: hypothetical protein VEK57_04205 [Thermoanaerobaculia bacterium]|nr:hypothetical protein [Thermoanaerobaculia bacterium]